MSASSVADFAIKLLQGLPPIVSAGMDIAGQIGQGMRMLQTMKDENRGPTAREYEALRALNEQAHNDFQTLATQREQEEQRRQEQGSNPSPGGG